jgi:hypothetical protein
MLLPGVASVGKVGGIGREDVGDWLVWRNSSPVWFHHRIRLLSWRSEASETDVQPMVLGVAKKACVGSFGIAAVSGTTLYPGDILTCQRRRGFWRRQGSLSRLTLKIHKRIIAPLPFC